MDDKKTKLIEKCIEDIYEEFGGGRKLVSPFYSEDVRAYFVEYNGEPTRDLRVIWDLPDTKFADIYVVFECDFFHPDEYKWAVRDLTEAIALEPEECHRLEPLADLEEEIERVIKVRIIPHIKELDAEYARISGIEK